MGSVNNLVQLCVDARRGRVANFESDCVNYTDEAARVGFNEILGYSDNDNATVRYRKFEENAKKAFAIIEDTLNISVPDSWEMSEFYRELVESKNGMFGDKNEFEVQDNSTLIVSRFSGNHWDIDRQKLPAGKSFSVETEWFAVKVYDELERFLKGVTTLTQMYDAIQRSIQRDIDDRIYSAFNGAGTYLPTQFQETGTFDGDKLIQLADRVSIESSRNVRLAGSKSALAKIYKGTNTAYLSNDMKNDINTTGYLRLWNGLRAVEIPQSFKRGTYDFRNPDDTIYVLPENYKPIKLYFEGNTRSDFRNEHQNNDQSISYQLQTKVGVGVVFDSVFGTYKITT